MNSRQNPLFWSFKAGHWFGVQVRVSWLLPLLLPWFLYEFKLQLGLVAWTVLTFSVLLHEFGHILAARATDGSGDEIFLWPLGGVASIDPASSPRGQMLTVAGGPLVNLLLCGLFLPMVIDAGQTRAALNPLVLPFSPAEFGSKSLVRDVQVVFFSVNWMLFLINLLPAVPLDGGQMTRIALQSRMGNSAGGELANRVGLFAGLLLALAAAFFFKSTILVMLGMFVVLIAIVESHQMQSGEGYDDSFMGYDFSQGYTSLERSTDKQPVETRRQTGWFQRWSERRRRERERRLLKRASDRYKSKGQERRES
jgi:stage IV sporulation protein FB